LLHEWVQEPNIPQVIAVCADCSEDGARTLGSHNGLSPNDCVSLRHSSIRPKLGTDAWTRSNLSPGAVPAALSLALRSLTLSGHVDPDVSPQLRERVAMKSDILIL
jgi:hypothetical protein